MIPIRLTIQGLYSYQEKQTIDFATLTGAHLFGIFGSVGSGKSTILEAITFALYGKTDRLNLSGDNRNYNMMNLKSSDLLIEFDFETGKEQVGYKALVKGKRNGKKFEEVKTLDRSAYQRHEGSWIPIEPEALEKAVGLSYDNFKRTIIIPQGQFQEFLQLGNKDRTMMMKELFNLDKYELFFKVTSLESKNNAQRQNVDGQLKQLGAVEEDQVKHYEDQLVLVNEEIALLTKTIVEYQKTEAEMKQLQVLVKKMEDTQLQYKLCKDREPEFAALEDTIRDYEKCVIQFKSLLESITQSSQRIHQKTEQIEKETAALKTSEAEIVLAETAFAEVKTAYDTRDLLKQRADELVKVARLNVLAAAVSTDEERLKKGKVFLDNTVARVEELKKEKEKFDLLIKEEKAKLPDLAMLSRVKTWHVENNNLCRQLENLKTDLLKYTNEKQRISEVPEAIYKDPVFASLPGEVNIAEAMQFLKKQIEQIKGQISRLDLEIEHCRVQAKLEEYAVSLHDGKECPLCGSLEHPKVLSPASLSQAMFKALKAKETLENGITKINDIIAQLSDLLLQLKFNLEKSEAQALKIQQMEAALASHRSLFQWENFREENVVNQAFSVAETMQKNIRQNEEMVSKVTSSYDKELVNKERFQGEIEKIQTTLTKSQTEISTLTSQVMQVNVGEYSTKMELEIESEKRSLLQKHAMIEKQFNELTLSLNQLHKVKDTVSGSLEAHQKELLLEQQTNAGYHQQFVLQLSQTGYKSMEDVKKILSQEMNLELQKQKLTEFRQQLAFLKSQTTQLELEIGNRSYDSDVHRKLVADINVLTEDLNQKNQLLGRATELLKKLKADLESKAKLQHKLEELDLRADNIRLMKSLFKGSGFVNFISSVYLQNLCNAANDRFFQLTRQKLSLEITDDNNFQVRDFMNGGKLRSVKTLSGGQTFQAALSLALALA
ncbi:MAG TPA: AAA family ATPase, partial [Prolixibacteraceae bacterium]|nr:AAA family ATPase [Prolixibacteraceae bacterium]